jgi:aerobic-type carbon monoxide dehydrogenase small subunit (CoxS/CutS family)
MSSTLPETSDEATRMVTLTVNGVEHRRTVPVRLLLSDFLRHELGLTGTHVGCEHGVCGCCTVLIDGRAARSCLALAVSLEGASVETVESLATAGGGLHPIQEAFHAKHALQCGFCTPGFLMSVKDFLETAGRADLTDEEIREGISGNLCRCTGYTNIVDAVRLAAETLYGPEA